MDNVPLFHTITLTPPDGTAAIALCLSLLLLLFSGLVSASEVAFFSLSPEDLDKIKENRHPSDDKIERLRTDGDRLLATVLICNTLINIAIIILLNYFFAKVIDFGGSGLVEFVFATVALTFLLLLFGEIMPKTYSSQHALGFCRAVAPLFVILNRLLRPLSSLLVRSQGLADKVVSRQTDTLTTHDLEQALVLTDPGEIKDESRMLEGILRFGGETVKDIMTPRVDLVDIDVNEPFSEVLRQVVEHHHSRIPVFSGTEDNIKGVLYTKDLLAHTDKPANFRWQNLIRPPFFVPETKMIDDLLNDFRTAKVHIAIVVDEFGGTSGIVTMEDILEEIVGEIDDEYDERKKPFTRLNQGTYIFDGKCLLVDFLRILHLPDNFFRETEGDADTLAGLMLELKGDFPKPGERLTCHHLTLVATEMDDRHISKVKVIVGGKHRQ